MDAKELVESTINAIRDSCGMETHNGYLLGEIFKFLEQEHHVIAIKSNYTVDGVTGTFWLPADKRTYVITMQEKRDTKK